MPNSFKSSLIRRNKGSTKGARNSEEFIMGQVGSINSISRCQEDEVVMWIRNNDSIRGSDVLKEGGNSSRK